MSRDIRYQGAIIQDDHILLIKHSEHSNNRSYWVIPGGGREGIETEEACVQREILEETHLRVTIERLLLDETNIPKGKYQRHKTYLCKVDTGEARPGYEPEEEVAQLYGITEVKWFNLLEPARWDSEVKYDIFTFPLLQKIQAALGYTIAD